MKKIVDFIKDALLELIFIGLTGLIVSLIEPSFSKVYVPIAILIILFMYLAIIYIYNRFNRPFKQRFDNEDSAASHLKKLINSSHEELCILSKVGTTIFFLFEEYVDLLKKGTVKIKILLVDPEYEVLIDLIDKMFIDQSEISPKWRNMIFKIKMYLNDYAKDGIISASDYNNLNQMLDGAKSYRDLIIASHYMWLIAVMVANMRAKNEHFHVTLQTLEIYYCKDIPDIKAWISDGKNGAIGNYDVLRLGRDNPVDFYETSPSHHHETQQFKNILEIWNYKAKESVLCVDRVEDLLKRIDSFLVV